MEAIKPTKIMNKQKLLQIATCFKFSPLGSNFVFDQKGNLDADIWSRDPFKEAPKQTKEKRTRKPPPETRGKQLVANRTGGLIDLEETFDAEIKAAKKRADAARKKEKESEAQRLADAGFGRTEEAFKNLPGGNTEKITQQNRKRANKNKA